MEGSELGSASSKIESLLAGVTERGAGEWAGMDPIRAELVLLREEFATMAERRHEELQQQLKSWMERQDLLAEGSLAWQHRLEARTQKQSALLSKLVGAAPTLREAAEAAGPELSGQGPPLGLVARAPGMPEEEAATEAAPEGPASAPPAEARPVWRRHCSETSATLGEAPDASSRSLLRGASRSRVWKQKKGKRKNVDQYLIVQKQAEAMTSQTRLHRIVFSKAFEWISVSLIVMNSVLIGWQVQYMAHSTEADTAAGSVSVPPYFTALQGLFCVLFTAELALRWAADGLLDFFRSADAAWNIFDIVIVFIGVVEMVVELSTQDSMLASISVVRVLRIVRIVRVVRVIRLLPFFHELRLMIDSIICSLKSFLWCMIILGMMFYVFGITMTSGACAHLAGLARQSREDSMQLRFGTVDKSMLSLYMAMSGGIDWADLYDTLGPLPVMYRILFLLFVSFALFAVVNVVTGVFVESAIRTSGKDRNTVIREELQDQSRYLNSMQEVFEEMDADDTGSISLDEFEKHLGDDRVIAYFNTLKLDVSDARTLFRLLDLDCSGSVDIDEFLEGCRRLKGESRHLDIAVMRYELAWMRNSLQQLVQNMALKSCAWKLGDCIPESEIATTPSSAGSGDALGEGPTR